MSEIQTGRRGAPSGPTTHHSPESDTAAQSPARVTVAATAGHIIEFYDYSVYGVLAVVLAPLFFSTVSPAAALLATFAVFGVPFLARPFGALLFGHLGDRLGRKQVLVITVMLMGLGTGLIGVLPTYDTAGVLAPILLVALRLIQGLSAGGEVGGVTTFVVESAGRKRRGLFGGFLGIGTPVGVALAAGVVLLLNTVLSEDQVMEWGWRVPFLLAIPLASIALYLRWRIEDSPIFQQARTTEQLSDQPVVQSLKQNRRVILLVAGVAIAQTVGGYLTTVYAVTYMSTYLGYSLALASGLASFGLLGVAWLIPLVGALSDRVGRKPILYLALAGYIVLPLPALLLMGLDNIGLAVVAFLLLYSPTLLMNAVAYTMYPELFPTATRYSGVSIAYTAGVVIGGTAPFLATALIGLTGNILMPAVLVVVAAVIGLPCLKKLDETSQRPLGD